nr:hypothetical protein [Tanacetum cinerariifolium]
MRLLRSDSTIEKRRRSEAFANWILLHPLSFYPLGLLVLPVLSRRIIISFDYLVVRDERGMSKLIDFIYDDMTLRAPTAGSLQEKNNAIQVNMDINNIDYFDPLFKPRVAYRFSDFIYKITKLYQQTLANEISLKFRKIIKFETLTGKESEFPNHHFEFISYNQLLSSVPYRDKNLKMVHPILTDLSTMYYPLKMQARLKKYQRKVDIENVEGNTTEFTKWDDMVKQFNKEEIQKLPPQSSLLLALVELTNTK